MRTWLFCLLALLIGCVKPPAPTPTDNPPVDDAVEATEAPETAPNYLSIVASAVSGASATMRIVQANAISQDNFVGCVAAGALADLVLDTAADALNRLPVSGPQLPEISMSLGVCQSSGKLDGAKVAAVVPLYVEAGVAALRSALDMREDQLRRSDCLAWAWLDAILTYLEGAAVPVLTFIQDPAHAVRIPGVEIDFAQCGDQ